MSKHPAMLALAALCLFSGTAWAHTGGHGVTSFVAGLTHPLQGLDHLLAMFAVGLWAAQQGARARWARLPPSLPRWRWGRAGRVGRRGGQACLRSLR